MATVNEHFERLIFEVYGDEEGKRRLAAFTKEQDEYAKSLKGIAKQAKDTAKAEVQAAKDAQKAAQSRAKSLEVVRNVAVGLAASFALVVAKGAELVQVFARVDAANGRMKFGLEQFGMSVREVEAAMVSAKAQFKDWAEFGVTIDAQTDAFTRLFNASKDYQQSLSDTKLAIDIHNASGWEMERATEALRKVRAGEVEVLKELGILTKEEAENLAKTGTEANRAAIGVTKLRAAFGGGGEGTGGLDQSLKSSNAKLDDTKRILGEILTELGDDTIGVIGRFAEFTGILEKGEHPVDVLNTRLEKLLNHAKSGDWEKLAGVLLLTNPATIPAGLALLGISSTSTDQETNNRAAGDFMARARARAGQAGQEAKDVEGTILTYGPEDPGRPAAKKGKAKDDPTAGGFLGEFGGNVDMSGIGQEIADAESMRLWSEAQKEKTRLLEEETQKRIKAEEEYFDELSKSIEKAGKEDEKAAKERSQQQEDLIMVAIDGSATLAKSAIKDKGAQAIIDGGIEVAKAFAAYPDPAGMAAHGFAAAQFFTVAAQAGVGGGKGGSGSIVKGSHAGKPGRDTLADNRERLAASGEQSRSREARESRNISVVVTSWFSPNPGDARKAADAIEREMQNRTDMRR